MENKSVILIEHIERKEKEVKLQEQISEPSAETTELQTELTQDNWRAKKNLALELHQMGFPADAIARILHLEGVQDRHDFREVVKRRSQMGGDT